MKHSFLEALENRRSYYSIGAAMSVSQQDIVKTIDRIIDLTPKSWTDY